MLRTRGGGSQQLPPLPTPVHGPPALRHEPALRSHAGRCARSRVCVLRERSRETLNSLLGRRARLARAARGSRRREQMAHEARRRRRRTEHCASGLSERRRASQRGRFAAGSGHLHCCCSWDSLSMLLRQAGGSTVLAGCSGRDSRDRVAVCVCIGTVVLLCRYCQGRGPAARCLHTRRQRTLWTVA